MAKKAQKGKPAKKVAKPVKKVAVKKPAKKVAPKKATKPVKKVAPKKAVKKAAPKKVAKPVKKVIAKKPVKKVIVKKSAPKKVAKPAKKIIAKKVAIKKVVVKKVAVKKVAIKKAAPKKAAIKKEIVKPIVKKLTKAEEKAIAKANAVIIPKPVPLTKKEISANKKKEIASIDMDDDYVEPATIVAAEYKAPAIRRPMGPAPTPHINNDKRTRYTDAELKEFKQLIIKKLTEAQKDYELLKSTLSHRDDHGTDDTSPTFKLLEDGSDVLSKEETAHLAGRQEKFIQNLQNALIRIENKTYGICRATGRLISKERLRSVPHATLAIEAKLTQHN